MLDRPSPNFDARPSGRPIDTLVLHYTGMKTADEAIARMCDPTSKVSAHYMIDEGGVVTRMVDESQRAWHAGVASWRGETNINGCSIGIELVNPGHEFGYRDFPNAQMAALELLAHDIIRRHAIPDRNIVGHADIAPERKKDPGEFFNWQRLLKSGIGMEAHWVKPQSRDAAHIQDRLTTIGYGVGKPGQFDGPTRAAIIAFQRHFRPQRVDGRVDEDTAGRIIGLAAQIIDETSPNGAPP